jgi:lysozyme|nr:MAG TPA_asm: LysA like endolysin [Caudoviricetes sp.]
MINFIDISSHQADLNLVAVSDSIQGVIVKATEGTSYVNPYCDRHYQQAKNTNLLRGFYHFAGSSDPLAEAAFFYRNVVGYIHDGIPVLDWEGNQTVDWVNSFVRQFHNLTGIWPWIYANPWRFNQGGVELNCARWIASYPEIAHPTFAQAASWNCPNADGNVVAWQFCSDGRLSGYGNNLDCSVYYGDRESWLRYADSNSLGGGIAGSDAGNGGSGTSTETLENENYKITIERK